MLAMPHRDDDRAVFQPGIAIGRDPRSWGSCAARNADSLRAVSPEKLDRFAAPESLQHERRLRGLIASRIGIKQAVQMHHEIAHLRIVHGRLRLGLPGGMGGLVVRIDADNVELREVLKVVLSISVSSPPKTRWRSCGSAFGAVMDRVSGAAGREKRGPATDDQPRFAAERLPVKSEGISLSMSPRLPRAIYGVFLPVSV